MLFQCKEAREGLFAFLAVRKSIINFHIDKRFDDLGFLLVCSGVGSQSSAISLNRLCFTSSSESFFSRFLAVVP